MIFVAHSNCSEEESYLGCSFHGQKGYYATSLPQMLSLYKVLLIEQSKMLRLFY